MAVVLALGCEPTDLDRASKNASEAPLGFRANAERETKEPNLVNASHLAELAALSYSDEPQFERAVTDKYGPDIDVRAFVAGNAHAYLVALPDADILVIRGSDTTADLFVDSEVVSCLLLQVDGMRVHCGFLSDALELLEAGLGESLRRSEHAERPLYLVGHSLGAATATAMVAYSVAEFATGACFPHACSRLALPTARYSFGEPRSLLIPAAVWVHETLAGLGVVPAFRFVNVDDPVARVPSTSWGYRHLSSIDESETLAHLGELGTHDAYSYGIAPASAAVTSFADHAIALYADKLSALVKCRHTNGGCAR